MKKFSPVKSKYLSLGIKEENIDYAIGAVKEDAKREHIIENLTASYRGMTEATAVPLLDELYAANGGEFKSENRGGYITGAILCILGIAGTWFFISMLVSGEWTLKILILSLAAAIFGLGKGIQLIIKSNKGDFRDTDDPI